VHGTLWRRLRPMISLVGAAAFVDFWKVWIVVPTLGGD
jgi:hypothetical protein